MGHFLSPRQFDKVLKQLSSDYRILAPVRVPGGGSFSDTDMIRYGEVSTFDAIVHDQRSDFSGKEGIFPLTQTLFWYQEQNITEPRPEDKGVILFLRPCDIHALKVFENIFVRNGGVADPYYIAARNKLKVFMLECREGFEGCFCVTMGTNRTEAFDVALRFSDDGVTADVRSEAFTSLFAKNSTTTEFTPEFPVRDHAAVRLPDSGKITNELFDDNMWTEYSSRCIACGRCNFVCPTCTCWSMQDVTYDDAGKIGERRRVWASCHVDRFTDMAGGHSFRKTNGERMRFKVLHKIYDYKKRFGTHMCTGCGRCDAICPEYIAYSEAINKVTRWTERK